MIEDTKTATDKDNLTKTVAIIKQEYRKQEEKYLREKKYLRQTLGGYFAGSAIDDMFRLFKLMKLSQYNKFVDLGSGDGRVVFVASLFTKARGVEIDPELHAIAEKMKHRLSIPAEFVEQDFLKEDISDTDIIFMNPDARMYDVEKKLHQEMKKHAMLIVYNAVFKPLNLKLVKEIKLKGSKALIYQKD